MKTSSKGIQLIKQFESFSSAPYVCPGGKKTIGYGHVIQEGETFRALSAQQADDLLMADLAVAEQAILSESLVLNQNQFDALASFIFNVGPGTFRKSSVLRLLKENKQREAMESLRKYCKHKVNGILKESAGLSRRRNAESALFLSPVNGR